MKAQLLQRSDSMIDEQTKKWLINIDTEHVRTGELEIGTGRKYTLYSRLLHCVFLLEKWCWQERKGYEYY